MEENKEPKRKMSKLTITIFGVLVMFINLLLAKSMTDEPFINFVVLSFLVCGVLGIGFGSIYRTFIKKDNK